jgi:hypothetical protein
MDGKCCRSSDGGRSNRYHAAMRRTAISHRHSNTQAASSQK